MIIVDARFGKYSLAGECNNITRTSRDVTVKVRGLINLNTENINWSMNHAHRFFGDPIFKVRKAIKVLYKLDEDGPILTKCFSENSTP